MCVCVGGRVRNFFVPHVLYVMYECPNRANTLRTNTHTILRFTQETSSDTDKDHVTLAVTVFQISPAKETISNRT